MEEDLIETAIGKFGRYQTWILIIIAFGKLPADYQTTSNVVFILPSVEYMCLDNNVTNYCPCQNPEYDTSTIVSSVTSEWDLVCNKTYLASLAQSMLQVGILAGSLLFGYISDRFGRKPAVYLSESFQVIFIAMSALVPDLWMFLLCRFLIGITTGGIMLCTYILLIELSGKSFRAYIIGLQEVSLILAYLTLPMIAYFVREWRYLQLAISVPWVLIFASYFFIPESPRWLITVGRKQEAVKLLTYIANKNNMPTKDIPDIVEKINLLNENHQKTGSYLDLIRTPKIRKYTIINALIWMFCAHTYYGVSQYIGRLQGNLYLNVILSAACLAPGVVLVVLATLYLRRKVSTIISFMTASISLFVFLFIPSDLQGAVLAFAIIGLVGAYTSFIQVYLLSVEVFPTVVRNSAMGFASVFARIGAFVAPFVVNIGTEWASITIFSGVALSAAILCSFLPETKDMTLLNTVNQTEKAKV